MKKAIVIVLAFALVVLAAPAVFAAGHGSQSVAGTCTGDQTRLHQRDHLYTQTAADLTLQRDQDRLMQRDMDRIHQS